MNKLAALVALVLAILTIGCPNPPKPAPSPTPDRTEVTAWREVEITLHADTAFTPKGRSAILDASKRWLEASGGRIRIGVEFDVDFDSIENLEAHVRDGHALMLGVLSFYPIVQEIDEKLASPGRTPMAVTVSGDEGPYRVFLIIDRIESDHFGSVVTHELGHVAGLPDLPTTGDVMSGGSYSNAPPVLALTRNDFALCRAYRLCP